MIIFLILTVIGIYVCQVALAGTLAFNFSLADVYEHREEAEKLTSLGFLAYLNVWLTKVFLPTLVALSVWFKKYKLTILLSLFSLPVFAISQHKSVLFYPLVVISVTLLFRRRTGLWILPFSLSILLFSCIAAYNFSDLPIISNFHEDFLVPRFLYTNIMNFSQTMILFIGLRPS